MATLSLRAYAVGLIAFMLIKVLAPGFFARQDMRTPVRIGVIAMATNMVLNLLFVVPLHFYWQIGHVGLAAATSVSAFLNALLLFIFLRKQGIYKPSNQWKKFMLSLTSSVTLMLLVLIYLGHWLGALDQTLWQQMTWWQRSGNIVALCATGFLVYAGALLATGFRVADLRGPAKVTSAQ
jgi:putative peptidoglycan lipid II flippase